MGGPLNAPRKVGRPAEELEGLQNNSATNACPTHEVGEGDEEDQRRSRCSGAGDENFPTPPESPRLRFSPRLGLGRPETPRSHPPLDSTDHAGCGAACHQVQAKKMSPQVVEITNKSSKKLSSSSRTFINAVICFIGSGVLGLPFALKHIGLVGGTVMLGLIAVISLHCMYLVADCKIFLQTERSKHIKTYGDIGFYAFGRAGALTVDSLIVLTQTGFCIAYLIMISESMHEVMEVVSKRVWILGCMPVLVLTSWLRNLKSIAPLSLLAEVATGGALITVLIFDVQELQEGNGDTSFLDGAVTEGAAAVVGDNAAHLANQIMDVSNATLPVSGQEIAPLAAAGPLNYLDLRGIPFFFGVAVYCFEGIGMVLPVMNSMRQPEQFKAVWGLAMLAVTVLYGAFALLGYIAFKGGVADIILTNLPRVPVTAAMKVSLCCGLLFTYPIMSFPVIELIEEFLGKTADSSAGEAMKRNLLRTVFVLGTGGTAYMIPKFGVFISLVGASASAALAFVLPCVCHLKLRYRYMNWVRRWREIFCIIFGLLGGIVGTLNAIKDMNEEDGGE